MLRDHLHQPVELRYLGLVEALHLTTNWLQLRQWLPDFWVQVTGL